MNVRELKELIKDLPDDMRVVEAYDGPCNYDVIDLALSVEDLYEWEEFVPGFKGVRVDSTRIREWIFPIPSNRAIKLVGKVLCVKT